MQASIGIECASTRAPGLVRRLGFCLAALAVSLSLPGCGGGDDGAAADAEAGVPAPAAATGLAVFPKSLSLAADSGGRLLALNGAGPVAWTSSDPAVATIEGRSVENGPPGAGVTIVTNWKFTAVRE